MVPRRQRFDLKTFPSRVLFLLTAVVMLGSAPGAAVANPALTATTLSAFQQSAEVASLGLVEFSNPPGSYEQGSGQAINFTVDGSVGSGHDVLVLAWSDETQSVVQSFAHTLTGSPWQIAAAHLDGLPLGRVNLQLMLRENGEVIDRAFHWVEVEPQPARVAPIVSFGSASSTYQQGSGDAINLAVEGDVPDGGDMLVLAWSDGEQGMVGSFAHTLTGEPWRIAADRLAMLPEGRNNLQVIVRLPGMDDVRANHWVVVEPELQAPQEPPSVSFPSNMPSSYSIGSGNSIALNLSGAMPDGGDIMAIAWSDSQQRMVDSFAHRIAGEPWQIASSQLDELPNGRVNLQLMLRLPGGETQRVTQWIDVSGGANDGGNDGGDDGDNGDGNDDGNDDGDNDDGGDGGNDGGDGDDGGDDGDDGDNGDGGSGLTPPDPNFVDRSNSGWTQFPRANDARVIYVSSSQGNDNNDGLSENRPVRSLNRAYNLLRNGYPDHMLLRRGDRWTDVFPGWGKSGRSKQQRMVVGTYGEGNRPIIGHGGGSQNAFSHRPTIRHVALVGLHFDGRGRNNNIRLVGEFHDFLIEDCYIAGARDNINAHLFNGGRPTDLQLRRSVIVDSRPSGGSHSQGLYVGQVNGVLVEDNVFDYNGWAGSAQPTIFNHNIYVSRSHDVTVKNNIFAHGSSFGIKLSSNATGGSRRVLVEDNILFGNANGITIGYSGASGYGSPYNFNDVTVRRNLFTRLGRNLEVGGNQQSQAFGLHITTLDRGLVEQNYFVHKTFQAGHPAIRFDDDRPNRDTLVQSNVVFNWYMPSTGRNTHLMIGNGAQSRWNEVQLAANRYVDASRDVAGYHGWIGRQATQSAFLAEARKQSREFWRPAYEAKTVVQYIREGYTLLPNYD